MKVSIITPSFNKTEYVADAIKSITSQTLKDWEYWILENSNDDKTQEYTKAVALAQNDDRIHFIGLEFTEQMRQQYYIPALLLNFWLPIMQGEYIYYLSDDDLIDTSCLEKVVNYLDNHSEQSVCWFSMKSISGNNQGWHDSGQIIADRIIEKNQGADCVLDGSQILFRSSILEQIEQPYFDTSHANASHCDGLFMNKLNKLYDFFPINETLLTHRRTDKSTHVLA